MSSQETKMTICKGQRGSALFVSLLILFAMTALGLLAVTSSQVEIMLAGNHRNTKRAKYMAEAGLMVVGDHITRDPTAFLLPTLAGSGVQTPIDIGGEDGEQGGAGAAQVFDLQHYGEDAIFVQSGTGAERSGGYDQRAVGFRVTVDEMRDLTSCPGFSSNTLCCKRITLISEGRVGDQAVGDRHAAGMARQRMMAQYLVPYPCNQ